MGSFSLPNYWKAAGTTPAAVALPKSLLAAAETDDVESDDEGSFFDLVLNLPKENSGEVKYESEDDDDDDNEDKELNFTITSAEDSDIPLEPKSTRFRIFKLALRKLKSPAQEPNASPKQSKFFTKYKVEEVPIASLFDHAGVTTAWEEKNSSTNSKELVQKYLRKFKPSLSVRMSKSKAEKPVEKTGEKNQKTAMQARLRLVCKRLGKSKSSSSAVAAVSSPQRRDDSLLMQQDGIQSAIAYCKRSFKAVSKGAESSLLRSKSDPGGDCL